MSQLRLLLVEAVWHQSRVDEYVGQLEAATSGEGNWTLTQNKLVADYIMQLAAAGEGPLTAERHVAELLKLLEPMKPKPRTT